MNNSHLVNGLRHMAEDHPCCEPTIIHAIDNLQQLERDNADLRDTLDAIIAADERAVELWRAAHPGKELVIPDRTELVGWLLEQNTALRKAKEMVELERCEMMRSMSLAQNQSQQLRADKERLDWLDSVGCWLTIPGYTKNNVWCWGASREVIDLARKEAQP